MLLKKFQRKILFILLVTLISQQHSIAQANKFPENGKRYLALLLLNFDNNPQNSFLDIIQQAAQNGCNSVVISVLWYGIYPSANATPDWRKVDAQVALCVKLGLKIGFRIHVAQKLGQLKNGFWENKYCMIDQNEAPVNEIYDQTAFSFSYQPSVDKSKEFIKEVCERYNYLQKQGQILWVSVTNTPTQELGYPFNNWKDGDYNKQYEAFYDLAIISQVAFQNWTSRKYGKIVRLNARWARDFESFDKVFPLSVAWSPRDGFIGNWGHDTYLFRHIQLKNFVEQTTTQIRSVNSSYKVIFDTGSVSDELSTLRGSLAFKDLITNLDGIKVNDDVTFDNRFTMDVLRSNTPLNKWIMNEAFCNLDVPLDGLEKQLNQNFEHGTQLMTVVVSTSEQMARVADLIKRTANKWLPKPVEYTPPAAAQSMFYNLSDIIDKNYKGAGIYDTWLKKGGADNKIIDIRLVEDLLSDTLQGTLNKSPIVKNIIPNKTIKEGRFFSYKIAPEVFYDSDGTIARINARGAPNWMSFQDNTFFGTPPEPGSYLIIIRATDDEGAAVETQFTITIDKVDPIINKKPYQKKNIPDTTIFYKQPFRFQIPDNTFADDDGFIGRIEILNQPSWLQIKSYELFGTANTNGSFKIVVRAYDDEEAMIETSFKINVVFPVVQLDLIGGGEPVKRVRVKTIIDNDVVQAKDLPDLVNIIVKCDAIFNRVDFTLAGPLSFSKSVTTVPFALFQGSQGFAPLMGSYSLKTSVYQNKELVTENLLAFKITNIDPVTKKPILIDDWVAYPNPTENYYIVKIPNNEDTSKLRFSIVTMSGQIITIPEKMISISDNTAYISLKLLQIPSGSYLLKIENDSGILKVKKIALY